MSGDVNSTKCVFPRLTPALLPSGTWDTGPPRRNRRHNNPPASAGSPRGTLGTRIRLRRPPSGLSPWPGARSSGSRSSFPWSSIPRDTFFRIQRPAHGQDHGWGFVRRSGSPPSCPCRISSPPFVQVSKPGRGSVRFQGGSSWCQTIWCRTIDPRGETTCPRNSKSTRVPHSPRR